MRTGKGTGMQRNSKPFYEPKAQKNTHGVTGFRLSYFENLYDTLKAKGICTRCRKRLARPGRIQCEQCADERKQKEG